MNMRARGKRHTTSVGCARNDQIAGPERGSVLLLLSLLMITVLGSAGLVVDVRNGYVVRAVLQHAVDDGALSAQRWNVQADDTASRSAEVAGRAVMEAVRVVQQELQSNGVAGISTTAATLSGERLTLTARAQVPTFFLTLFGIRHWQPVARAEAALGAPGTPLNSPENLRGSSSEGPPWDAVLSTAGSSPVGPTGFSQTGPLKAEGGATAAGPMSAGGVAPASGAPSPPDATSPGQEEVAGPCNCDGIAAGDPQAAKEVLDRMGVTPETSDPFRGDLTSEMGFGGAQSSNDGGAQSSGDEGW